MSAGMRRRFGLLAYLSRLAYEWNTMCVGCCSLVRTSHMGFLSCRVLELMLHLTVQNRVQTPGSLKSWQHAYLALQYCSLSLSLTMSTNSTIEAPNPHLGNTIAPLNAISGLAQVLSNAFVPTFSGVIVESAFFSKQQPLRLTSTDGCDSSFRSSTVRHTHCSNYLSTCVSRPC